jgi:hypothetical protein
MRDPELSGRDNRFILTKKINNYFSAGTRSGTDIYNDLRLATGGLKNTNRFKSADKTLKDAKELYPDYATTIGFKSWW